MTNVATATSGESIKFEIGPAKRPPIRYDIGFLTLPLYGALPSLANLPFLLAKQAAWTAAEVWDSYEAQLKRDAPDGMAAYHHYLFGYGRPLEFSYEKYVLQDWAGKTTLASALEAAILGAEGAFRVQFQNDRNSLIRFSITSASIPCGAQNRAYPYPETPKLALCSRSTLHLAKRRC